MARRDERSPITSPRHSPGTCTSTCDTGSSTTGRASLIAALKASRPAILKLISEESTEWCFPS